MLEIKYKNTGVITAWVSSPEHTGGHFEPKPSEKIVVLDVPIPEKSCSAYLFDKATQTLADNPSCVEPEPVRDLGAEIDELKAKIETLEKK